MHPELRDLVREFLLSELGDRSEHALLALESAWVVLGYGDERGPVQYWQRWALACLTAGLVEAEQARGLDVDRRSVTIRDVHLRLIPGGEV